MWVWIDPVRPIPLARVHVTSQGLRPICSSGGCRKQFRSGCTSSLRPPAVAPNLDSMWTQFLLATILATGLLVPELRRLANTYGCLVAVVAGACAIVAVAVWLLVLFSASSQLAGPFRTFSFCHLLATFVLPLSTFLYARRRFSIPPSLLPAGLMFALVSFVFLNIGLGLGRGLIS